MLLFLKSASRVTDKVTCHNGRRENVSEPFPIGSECPQCVKELVPFLLMFSAASGTQRITSIFPCTPKVSKIWKSSGKRGTSLA